MSPCLLHNEKHDVMVFIHGGDYVVPGVDVKLNLIAEQMGKRYACKVQIAGPGATDDTQMKVLNFMMARLEVDAQQMVMYEVGLSALPICAPSPSRRISNIAHVA